MKKIFTLLLAAGLLSSCGSGGSSGGAQGDSTATGTTGTKKEPTESSTKWSYEDKEDKMTSKKTYIATINSDNELQFEFPYDGGSTGGIMLRKKDGSTDVMLTISKGQFVGGVDGATIKVRFDNNKALTFDCSESSDSSSDILFINNTKKFITNLKKSKKMIVQAEFYESGLKEMEFTTAGFKWNH